MRRLSAEERALWARVAGTVRDYRPQPIHNDHHSVQLVEERFGHQVPIKIRSLDKLKTRQHEHSKSISSSSGANTLDATWDRSIATGRIRPERTIDLHGHTLSTAHARLERGLAEAIRDELRVVLLVTGRAPRAGTSRLDMPLRGIIRASVGDWLAGSPYRDRIAAIRNAHPRHGGAGALYVILRRARG